MEEQQYYADQIELLSFANLISNWFKQLLFSIFLLSITALKIGSSCESDKELCSRDADQRYNKQDRMVVVASCIEVFGEGDQAESSWSLPQAAGSFLNIASSLGR